jgi:hypothetical protein
VPDFDLQQLAGLIGAAAAQRKFVSEEYAQLERLRENVLSSNGEDSHDDMTNAIGVFVQTLSESMKQAKPYVAVSSARMGFDLAMTGGNGIGDEWKSGAGMGTLVDFTQKEMNSNSPAFSTPIHRELEQMLERICLVTMPWEDPEVYTYINDNFEDEE